MPALDLFLQLDYLPIQFLQVIHEPSQQLPEGAWQFVLTILQDRRQALSDMYNPLWHYDPVFGQQPPDLIGLGRARLYEPLACPMQ